MLSYIHPVLAALVLALLGYVASLAVRARNDKRHRDVYLARHARLAPWMYAAVLASAAGGLTTTFLERPWSELATSGHFRVGVPLVLALTASMVSSRWIDRPAVRAVHPWFGVLAILLAAGQVFFGLQILP